MGKNIISRTLETLLSREGLYMLGEIHLIRGLDGLLSSLTRSQRLGLIVNGFRMWCNDKWMKLEHIRAGNPPQNFILDTNRDLLKIDEQSSIHQKGCSCNILRQLASQKHDRAGDIVRCWARKVSYKNAYNTPLM